MGKSGSMSVGLNSKEIVGLREGLEWKAPEGEAERA